MAQILVIDDEYECRVAFRKALEHVGHAVLEASDGEEGILLYREQQPDLVILDILMPGKEGIETTRELKREFPDVKIIAMSGSGTGYLDMAKEFGAERTFSKPFKGEEMLKAVKKLLGK